VDPTNTDTPVTLPAVPAPLRWLNAPTAWRVEGDDALTITSGPRTDLFSDPGGPDRFAGAPALLGRLAGDFTLSAHVSADLVSTYDAGVLCLHRDAGTWAKLCLELSPQGLPMVVSVVTRGTSDDANGFTLDGGEVWLRLARVGGAYAFHASTDGQFWHLVRYFALDADGSHDTAAGFLAQSPLGEGNTVRFTQITCARRTLNDLRGGE
jgi:regulation of enolase protein 1 (concanavalin A-like superfamily)